MTYLASLDTSFAAHFPNEVLRARRRRLRAAAVLAPLAALFLAELALRVFWPQPPREFSDGLFARERGLLFLVPGARGTHADQEFVVAVEGNGEGYRAGTWADRAVPGRTVWLFGDSFAFGWGVEAEETSAARLIEAGWAVYDLGMPGDAWREYLARLELAEGTLPRPDAIVVATYDNDFSLPDGAPAPPAPGRWARLRALALETHLGRLGARVRGARKDHETAERAVHEPGFLESEAWRRSAERIASFLDRARELAPRVVVFRIVPAWLDRGSDHDAALDRALEDLVRTHGATYGRFAPDPSLYFERDRHLTAAGQAALAERWDLELRE